MKERVTKKNRVTGYSERRKGIEGVNGVMFEFHFLNWAITKCNWQKDETLNP